MTLHWGNGCTTCCHQKVCKNEKAFKEEAAEIGENLKQIKTVYMDECIQANCRDWMAYPKESQ